MTISATIRKTHSMGGVSFTESQSITADAAIVHDVSAPVAWAGELTTRTGDTVGTITIEESAHEIDTGDRIDLYWTASGVRRYRRGVTVGTVSGNLVPITGGAGDVLPTQSADIVAAPTLELNVGIDGDNVVAILLYLGVRGQFTFTSTESEDVELMNQVVGAIQCWDWNENNGEVNPLTNDSIGKVFVSQSGVTAAATARLAIAHDDVATA